MTAAPTVASLLAGFSNGIDVPTDRAVAAVLAVLRERQGDVEVLLIERAENPLDPASGQIGLPGGRVEPSERSLVQTALRECYEEVGIGGQHLNGPPRFVLISRALSSRMRVAIYAGELKDGGPEPSPADPKEVASVFWLPRSVLAHPKVVERETPAGPISVPAVLYQGHVVWGFTLRALRILFGWEPGAPEGSAE